MLVTVGIDRVSTYGFFLNPTTPRGNCIANNVLDRPPYNSPCKTIPKLVNWVKLNKCQISFLLRGYTYARCNEAVYGFGELFTYIYGLALLANVHHVVTGLWMLTIQLTMFILMSPIFTGFRVTYVAPGCLALTFHHTTFLFIDNDIQPTSPTDHCTYSQDWRILNKSFIY